MTYQCNRFSAGRVHELRLLPFSHMILLTMSFKAAGVTGSAVDLEEEEFNPKSVAVEDVIFGEYVVTLDEHGPGAIEPKVMSVPKELTPHQKARHFIFTCRTIQVVRFVSLADDRTIPTPCLMSPAGRYHSWWATSATCGTQRMTTMPQSSS